MPGDASRSRPSRRPPGGGRRPFAIGLICALTLLAVIPASAQQGSGSFAYEEPRFLIEKITVENAHKFSPHIIAAESLLVEGRTYSEGELRDAMYRVKRLAMVLDAEFSLRKGSERGRYELVISVVETRLWFFGLAVDLTAWSDEISVNGLTTTSSTQGASPVIGRRFSAGRHGIVYLGFGGQDASFQVGYTHYNLFSRSVLFNVNVGYSDCASERADDSSSDPGDGGCRTDVFDLGLDPTFASWSLTGETPRLRLNLDVPIRGNHGVRVLVSYRFADAGIRRQAFTPSRFDVFSDRDELRFNLSWIYNSLDDPVFPSRGRLVQAGLDLSYLSTDLVAFGLEPGGQSPLAMTSRQGGVLAIGSRFWPITGSQSLSGRVEAFVGWSGIDNVPTDDGRILAGDLGVGRVALAVGHAAFISRVQTERKRRDVRWESELEVFYSATSPDFDMPDNPRYGVRIGAGVTWRNRWGVFRFRLGYVNGRRR